MINGSTMSDTSSRRRWWTPDEDRVLQEEVKNQLKLCSKQSARNWSAIAQNLPGRSNKDCRKRWTKISLSSRKGTWTGTEDHVLREAVAKFGFQWTKVAEMVGSRHPDQCAKRWHHSLDPNVKRGPWISEEDGALIDAVRRVGRDWKEIGRELFPTRSTTDIKNRYVILSRRQRLSPSSQGCSPLDIKPLPTDCNPNMPLISNSCNPDSLNLSHSMGLSSQEYPQYLFHDPCALSRNPDGPFSEVDNPTWELSWPTFSGHVDPLSPSSVPGIESCDPSLLTYTTDCASTGLSTPSTLVLDYLQPETVNLVIDTLLQTNSKFGMRLYNTGS